MADIHFNHCVHLAFLFNVGTAHLTVVQDCPSAGASSFKSELPPFCLQGVLALNARRLAQQYFLLGCCANLSPPVGSFTSFRFFSFDSAWLCKPFWVRLGFGWALETAMLKRLQCPCRSAETASALGRECT